ncbi:hypothetical protein [Azospirillum doebereinerae]
MLIIARRQRQASRRRKAKGAPMDADTAWAIMSSLDEAEALLSRVHLRDGQAGANALAQNRSLLDEARRRLDQAHAME